MGRLNAALNELFDRGVFAVGPTTSEQADEVQDDAPQSAEDSEPEVSIGPEPTGSVADARSEEVIAPIEEHESDDGYVEASQLEEHEEASNVGSVASEDAPEWPSRPSEVLQPETLDVPDPTSNAEHVTAEGDVEASQLEKHNEAANVGPVAIEDAPESPSRPSDVLEPETLDAAEPTSNVEHVTADGDVEASQLEVHDEASNVDSVAIEHAPEWPSRPSDVLEPETLDVPDPTSNVEPITADGDVEASQLEVHDEASNVDSVAIKDAPAWPSPPSDALEPETLDAAEPTSNVEHVTAEGAVEASQLEEHDEAPNIGPVAIEEAPESPASPTEIVEPESFDPAEPITESAEASEASALDNAGDSELSEEQEEEFKVPSQLFDTNTADMDELRAQLGVLTKAERESLGERQDIDRADQEIIRPIFPEPWVAETDEIPGAELAATDEVHALREVTDETDELHADPEPAKKLVEPMLEMSSDLDVGDQETMMPKGEPSISDIAKSDPHHEGPAANLEPPHQSPYQPVLNTWVDLPQQPIATDAADEQEDADVVSPSVSEQPEAEESVPKPGVETELNDQVGPTPVVMASNASSSRIVEISRTPPTEFEITTAERLLQTEFGERIQQLNEHIASQLPGKGPHVILLLSMKPDGQRAEAIAGLGMFVCAQRTLPTLLVDADVEKRQISRDFAKHGPGLMEAISNEVPWGDSVKGTSCDKLRLLPCGTDLGAISNSYQAELDRFPAIINEWKQVHGLVIIDGGLTGSPLVTPLSKCADATFLCVPLGSTNREELLETTEYLTQAGARLKGCITTGPISH